MKITISAEPALAHPSTCLVAGVRDDKQLGPSLSQCDQWVNHAISRGLTTGVIGTSVADVTTIPLPGDDQPQLAIVVGRGASTGACGKYDNAAKTAFELGGRAMTQAMQCPHHCIVFDLSELTSAESRESFIAGAIRATESQALYRKKNKTEKPDEIVFAGADNGNSTRGAVLGNAINFTRSLVNQPPNILYPESFCSQVAQMATRVGLEIEIWDRARLEQERCHALLAVAGASDKDPRLLMLRHRGGDEAEQPLALVGKGVTFDSGGLSLKPSDAMTDMKCDMAGAATVVGAMQAIAELNVPRNVYGYCGLVENMIAGNAYKLGDVVTSRSGKTVEILNTDAEGRVVLADVLNVAGEANPVGIIDLATLTGACMVALGHDYVGLFSNTDAFTASIESAAEACGELVWNMPMHKLFDEQIESKIADIKNVGAGRWGGAITAAKFLEQFVEDTPWAHLDIAGPAFSESSKPFCDAGATGVMVQTLVRFAEQNDEASSR